MLGERISALLQDRGMTQRELAEKVGTTEASVSRYLKNGRMPKADVLWKIAQALGVTTDELLNPDEAHKKADVWGEWIPCSERLPDKYGEYYVTWTCDYNYKPFWLIEIIECEETNEFDYDNNVFKMEWILNDTMKSYSNPKVVAWMPLPEPYKEEL